MLMVETDEKGMLTETQITKEKGEKIYKKLVTTLLELILIKSVLLIMKNLVK